MNVSNIKRLVGAMLSLCFRPIDLVYNLCISVRLYVSSFLLSGPSLGPFKRYVTLQGG